MKFQFSLLFSASCLLFLTSAGVTSTAVDATPVRSQVETTTSGDSERLYQTCKKNENAVVTIYSGAEIGTGSIVSPNGLIITNYHVVQEAAQSKGTKIYVKLKNGTRYTGQIIAPDQPNDLAVVKLDTQETFLNLIPLAKPDSIYLGQAVCAIGNPFGLTSISVGTLKEFRGSNDLKSAIFLNRGNSGGALLNEDGEMIGVNKSIWLSATGENTGISFATNIRVAQALINTAQLSKKGLSNSVTSAAPLPSSDSSLQIANRPVTSGGILGAIVDGKSLTVRQIVLGSPADSADSKKGLRPGDRLVKLNGKPLNSLAALQAVLSRRPPMIDFAVERGSTIIPIQINFKQTTQIQ